MDVCAACTCLSECEGACVRADSWTWQLLRIFLLMQSGRYEKRLHCYIQSKLPSLYRKLSNLLGGLVEGFPRMRGYLTCIMSISAYYIEEMAPTTAADKHSPRSVCMRHFAASHVYYSHRKRRVSFRDVSL